MAIRDKRREMSPSKSGGAAKRAGRGKSGTSAKTARKRATAPSAPVSPGIDASEPIIDAVAHVESVRRDLSPVVARPSRSERAAGDTRLAEIDETCAAWAHIIAERLSADQTFAELVEAFAHRTRDVRGLFLWDALQAAEAHVALIQDVLASHIRDRRGDPVAILAELRARQTRVAAVYAVNAFLAVLNQMKPEKPRWLALDDLDPRFAVLALAHQTLGYALEAMRVAAPPDITDHILHATQDETVWIWRRMPEPGTDTLAACAAAASFFRALGAESLTSTDEVAALYGEHASARRALG